MTFSIYITKVSKLRSNPKHLELHWLYKYSCVRQTKHAKTYSINLIVPEPCSAASSSIDVAAVATCCIKHKLPVATCVVEYMKTSKVLLLDIHKSYMTSDGAIVQNLDTYFPKLQYGKKYHPCVLRILKSEGYNV